MDLEEVRAKLSADTSEFESKLGGAIQTLEKFAGSFGKVAAVAAAAALFAKVASSVLDLTEKVGKEAEALEHASQQTGISTQRLQELQPAMNRVGLSAQEMTMGFRRLSQNIVESQDITSKAAQTFGKLGIELTGLESPSQVLDLIADRVSKMPEGFQKIAIGTDLMGRGFSRLLPIMNQGAEGFRKSAEEAHAMHLVLSGPAKKALQDMDDSFDNVKTSSDNFWTHLALFFAPATEGFNKLRVATFNWATTTVDAFTIASRTLAERFQGIVGFLGEAMTATSVPQIIEAFKRWDAQTAKNIETIRQAEVATKDVAAAQAAANALTDQALAKKLAEVELGKTLLQIIQRETQERNEIFGNLVEEEDKARELAEGPYAQMSAFDSKRLEDMKRFNELMGGSAIGIQEQGVLMERNKEIADEVAKAEQTRRALIAENVVALQSEAEAGKAFAAAEAARAGITFGFGANEAVRQAQFLALAESQRALTAVYKQELDKREITQQQFDNKILALDYNTTAARIAAVKQFPDFWESQLQSIVAADSFAMGQILSSGEAAFAQYIVEGKSFERFWISLQETLLQAATQRIISETAKFFLGESQQAAAKGTFEAVKTGWALEGSAQRMAIAETEAATNVSVWTSTSEAVTNILDATMDYARVIADAVIEFLSAIITKAGEALSAISSVLSSGGGFLGGIFGGLGDIFGSLFSAGPLGNLIETPIAASTTFSEIPSGVGALFSVAAFQHGGLVTQPTIAKIGEAGPELVLPTHALAGLFSRQSTFIFEMDRKEFARIILHELPGMVYRMGIHP